VDWNGWHQRVSLVFQTLISVAEIVRVAIRQLATRAAMRMFCRFDFGALNESPTFIDRSAGVNVPVVLTGGIGMLCSITTLKFLSCIRATEGTLAGEGEAHYAALVGLNEQSRASVVSMKAERFPLNGYSAARFRTISSKRLSIEIETPALRFLCVFALVRI
jgi:hypothetical protein